MTIAHCTFGVMDCTRWDGGYIGLQREFPSASAFAQSVREYVPAATSEQVRAVWLAWRCSSTLGGEHTWGFTPVADHARGATPGWQLAGWVARWSLRELAEGKREGVD